jgi:ubiquinone/menaquinone biosynthesis C-methylase UbiE
VDVWQAEIVTADNPFDVDDETARNYARSRPFYHDRAVEVVFGIMGRSRAEAGLDVGCGTGLSTQALAAKAQQVVAIDRAPAMLRAATNVANTVFVCALAERLPVRSNTVDVVTCAAAMHWFTDQAFDELARVVCPGGYVAVYSDFFLGEVEDEPRFSDWLCSTYLPRLPTPSRRDHYNRAALERRGFAHVSSVEGEHDVLMDRQRLASYLMTQSNATNAMTSGQFPADALRTWLENELPKVISKQAANVRFAHRVWVAQRRCRRRSKMRP